MLDIEKIEELLSHRLPCDWENNERTGDEPTEDDSIKFLRETSKGLVAEIRTLRTQLAESKAEAERWKKVADQAIEYGGITLESEDGVGFGKFARNWNPELAAYLKENSNGS
jgi:hypothetical protein